MGGHRPAHVCLPGGLARAAAPGSLTDKRLASGEISEEQIIQVIEDYQPSKCCWGASTCPP